MPTVTLTLTDTPHGGVAIHSTYIPAVGNPCSPAQDAALEILKRTHKEWGVNPAMAGVDIDAVHRAKPAAADWALCEMARHVRHANPNMSHEQCTAYASAELGRT